MQVASYKIRLKPFGYVANVVPDADEGVIRSGADMEHGGYVGGRHPIAAEIRRRAGLVVVTLDVIIGKVILLVVFQIPDSNGKEGGGGSVKGLFAKGWSSEKGPIAVKISELQVVTSFSLLPGSVPQTRHSVLRLAGTRATFGLEPGLYSGALSSMRHISRRASAETETRAPALSRDSRGGYLRVLGMVVLASFPDKD